MPGTTQGGKAAAVTNKERFGEDFYIKIGRLGGSGHRPTKRAFHMNPELARRAGIKGGKISKRRGKNG